MAGDGFDFFMDRICVAGEPWSIELRNVADAHSFTVEFSGPSGGIYRYYPRRRNNVAVQFCHPAPGSALIAVAIRNARLLTIGVMMAKFEILAQRPMSGMNAEPQQVSASLTAQAEVAMPVLDATGKPPMAMTYNAANSPSGHGLSPTASPGQTRDVAKMLQDRVQQRLMNRLNRE